MERKEHTRLASKCEVELLHPVTSKQTYVCWSSAAAACIAVRALINSTTVLNAVRVNAESVFRSASTRLRVQEEKKESDQCTKLI